ncbi:MAG TPA: dihydrofolate reductase family protein [Verrucomicrobiae bacterium]|nr:dihydrofolate reductase family protein [Verrucomicrobiae bacterium]
MKRSAKRLTRRHVPRSALRTPRFDQLPFVFSNFAITADGKIAFANRQFVPFAGKRDQEHLLELRATADAVMSGARTVDLSSATLGPGGAKYRRQRIARGLSEFNLRIIVSGSGSIDPNARIFKYRPATLSPTGGEGRGEGALRFKERAGVRGQASGNASQIIVLTTARASAKTRQRLEQLGAIVKICGRKEINFRTAFRWLRQEWKVKRLLCEGGGELHDAIIRAGLLNELHLTISPKIFGGRNAPTLADGTGFAKLADAAQFKLKSAKRIGDEMFLVYTLSASLGERVG